MWEEDAHTTEALEYRGGGLTSGLASGLICRWPHGCRAVSLSLARHLGERMASLVPVQNAW